ncbi:MAG: ABC transporter permease [Candidatus Micrarchaeota archaeon]
MKALRIALHEYLVGVRRKEFLLITLGLPAFMFGVVLLQMYVIGDIAEAKGSVGYVDGTGLFENITSPGSIELSTYDSEEDAMHAFVEGRISRYFVIPEDYIQSGYVRSYMSSEGMISSGSDRWFEESLRKSLLSGRLEEDIYNRAVLPAIITPVFLDGGGNNVQPNLLKIVIPYLFSFMFVMAAFMTSGFLLQSVVSEKENRVMEVLLSSVSPFDLMAGKIIGLGAVGLTQVIIWGVAGVALALSFSPLVQDVAPLVGEFEVPYVTIALSAIYFVLGYLIFASVYAGVGAISTTQREGQQIAGMFGFIAVLPLMFSAAIVKEPNSLVVHILSFFPLTAPVVMMMRLSLTDMSALEIFASIAVLAGFVVGLMYLSAKVFRIGVLMYGKRPGVRELLRIVSESG